MAWVILIASGMLEAVWASALAASHGLRRWRPALLFFVAVTVSMIGLGYAMQTLPVGTAYAVWVGIGAALTLVWSFITKQERASMLRIALLALLIGSVIGLKVVS